ncbi:iron-containing alcohol dehydrogenase [Vibrio parahaemolyticus]|uniref:iron-containing alcohol dehydrogenase n=1 Tax=Vibrio parahaemolyticus TaxID=670 RepID=UPI0011245E46|nr:iron-containing alcohol dehydrogenase [Vibrio parahaemolyticus]TOP86012.1 NADH-dependent alcohol dehydrogenase [Vibrio parahaemolyticus]
MLNFDFYNPTRIVFGKETIEKIDSLIPHNARVLILYGGESAEKTGTLAEVRTALGKRDIHEFGGIEPNPTYETVLKAVELVKAQHIDFLLAVGGGSVIDGTKFVAAASLFEGDDTWQIMETWGSNVTKALPFGVILTLPATGSEMNSAAVITRKSTKTKAVLSTAYVFPQFSVLDPTKTYTLPARQLANGVVDAFVHTIEQYLTYPVDAKVQDRYAEGLLQTLIEIGPKVVKEPADYDSRANLMWTAAQALNGLNGAGVPQDWATHFIGHELTALHEIDHGRTLAIVLPSLMKVLRQNKHDKLLQYAERVWAITDGNEETRIDLAIKKTRDFFEELGVKTRLSDYGLGEKDISPIINQLTNHGMVKLGEHQDITPEMSRRILELSI